MSLAISFGDFEDENSVSGAVYFNSTTAYNRKYSGRVSEHPLEFGANVSDHYSSNNPTINIEGVISGVEISYVPSGVELEEQPVINNQAEPELVAINSGEGLLSTLKQFIPASVTQFMPKEAAVDIVFSEDKRENKSPEVEALMYELLNGVYYNEARKKWENRMTPVVLYELDGYFITSSRENLVITDFSVNEDAESGEGLFFNMTLEEVRFVTLDDADAPKPEAKSTTSIKTKPQVNKGGTPPSTFKVPPPEEVDQSAYPNIT